MYQTLRGLRIVEVASFIAAPSCGLHLAQLGAEVIRVDPIGGAPDRRRWPLAASGDSLYWEGVNKGKKSISLDLRSSEGRALLFDLAAAPGEGNGLLVTNLPRSGFLKHEEIAARRPDAVTLRVTGWGDGRTALDYTVNSAIGVPMMTGPEALGDRPVNHVLPAWDIATGYYAAVTLLAAERQRRLTGEGQEILLALGDVAMACMGHIGQIAEVSVGQERPRLGNDLYGGFGRDFATAEGRRIQIVGLTRRQWADMVRALDIGAGIAALEARTGADFAADEGARYLHREALNGIVAEAVGRHDLPALAERFAGTGVCWAPFNTLSEALGAPGLIEAANPVFADVTHPSGARYLTPGAAAVLVGQERRDPAPAPRMAEHTDEVLAQLLDLPSHRLRALREAGTIA
ncbi:CoA transferase [Salipiger sp.]|uniref:CoA transferase n=1 Tax=Salipiger sp. TaxID=2078585 RepID=UPI003A9815C8